MGEAKNNLWEWTREKGTTLHQPTEKKCRLIHIDFKFVCVDTWRNLKLRVHGVIYDVTSFHKKAHGLLLPRQVPRFVLDIK